MTRIIIPLIVIALGITIYALIEAIGTEKERVRILPKPAWIISIILVPPVGAILWLIFGYRRLPRGGFSGDSFPGRKQRPAQPKSPDDDEEFLRQIDIQRAQRRKEKELEAREAELRAREERLRRGESDEDTPPSQ